MFSWALKIDLFGGGKLNLHGNAVGMRTQAQEHKVKITVSMVTFLVCVVHISQEIHSTDYPVIKIAPPAHKDRFPNEFLCCNQPWAGNSSPGPDL